MGADGHIRIWRDDLVRSIWPDCDQMFAEFSTHYCDEMDGIKYHHVYWGDNGGYGIDDVYPKYWSKYEWERCGFDNHERLLAFADWLWNNGVSWEVWT